MLWAGGVREIPITRNDACFFSPCRTSRNSQKRSSFLLKPATSQCPCAMAVFPSLPWKRWHNVQVVLSTFQLEQSFWYQRTLTPCVSRVKNFQFEEEKDARFFGEILDQFLDPKKMKTEYGLMMIND